MLFLEQAGAGAYVAFAFDTLNAEMARLTAMPRYFFHIMEGLSLVAEDQEGEELHDLAAVRGEAVQSAREIIAQGVLAGEDINGRELRIQDEAGQTVLRVHFKDVVS